VLLHKVRLERTRQFGACYLGLELWRRLQLDRFFGQVVDDDPADVPWSGVVALLAINRLCAPGSELAVEQRWYPSTALDDLLGIEEGKINDTRLYRCLDRILPHKTKLERHLKDRYGALFEAAFDVLLYDLTSTYVEGAAEKNPMMRRGDSRDHRPDCEQMVIALIVNEEGFPISYVHAVDRGGSIFPCPEERAFDSAFVSSIGAACEGSRDGGLPPPCQHRHSGLALLTPAMVHYGPTACILEQRQTVLDVAYQAHPERFVRQAPKHLSVPTEVWINKPPNVENKTQ
jgi:hypothetical protein